MRLRRTALTLTLATLACGGGGTAFVGEAHAAPKASRTDPTEAARVDSVRPGLVMAPCFTAEKVAKLLASVAGTPAEETAKKVIARYEGAECGTAKVPLDYDKPGGPTYDVPVVRRPARKPEARIGTLFLNPGGPGGSGVSLAAGAQRWLSPEIADRFDLVGVEPRQMGVAEWAACYDSQKQADDGAGKAKDNPFPTTSQEWVDFYWMARDLGAHCATRRLMNASTTAEVVRDHEVVRQALKAGPMNFLGFSYGTYVAQVYGNMFPDRMRAIVADGVVEADDWAGTKAPRTLLDTRLQSAEGAEGALEEALRACDAAGAPACAAAKKGDADLTAAQKWEFVKAELTRKPLQLPATWQEIASGADPTVEGEVAGTTVAQFLGNALGILYAQEKTAENLTAYLAEFYAEVKDRADGATPAPGARAERLRGLAEIIVATRAAMADDSLSGADISAYPWREGKPFPAPYRSDFEAYSSVMCTDGRHPVQELDAMRQSDEDGRRNPDFGKVWGWDAAQCAEAAWTPRDPGVFRGPFTKRTTNPMMFVGDTFDPATNRSQAVKSARRQPGAVVVTSESWGHTAYGTSACTTGAVDAYLLDPTKAEGAHCQGDYVPFRQTIAGGTRGVPVAPFGGPVILKLTEQTKH